MNSNQLSQCADLIAWDKIAELYSTTVDIQWLPIATREL